MERSRAEELIQAERRRQIQAEGFTSLHDDQHQPGELTRAGSAYLFQALHQVYDESAPPPYWPWEKKWWKPKEPLSNLVRAGALFLAEKERKKRFGDYQTEFEDFKINQTLDALEKINDPTER